MERIIKLAEKVMENHLGWDSDERCVHCVFCDISKLDDYPLEHEPHCPVLIAEEILKEEKEKCLKELTT